MGTAYGYYSYLHSFVSTGILSAGDILPRFATAYFKSYVLWFFMAAIVFLGVRPAPPRRTRPHQRGSRLAGGFEHPGHRRPPCRDRTGGCDTPVSQRYCSFRRSGTVGRALGWPVDPLEPVATFTFFFVDAIPAFCSVVCHRLLPGSRSAQPAGYGRRRLGAARSAHVEFRAHAGVPSAGRLADPHRRQPGIGPGAAVSPPPRTSCSAARYFCSPRHSWSGRRPSTSGRTAARPASALLLGIVLAVAGAVGIGAVVHHDVEDLQAREAWLAAHRDIPSDTWPTVLHIQGDVAIDPGRALDLEIEMQLAAPADPDRARIQLQSGSRRHGGASRRHRGAIPSPRRSACRRTAPRPGAGLQDHACACRIRRPRPGLRLPGQCRRLAARVEPQRNPLARYRRRHLRETLRGAHARAALAAGSRAESRRGFARSFSNRGPDGDRARRLAGRGVPGAATAKATAATGSGRRPPCPKSDSSRRVSNAMQWKSRGWNSN